MNCPVSGKCGGCCYSETPYEEQLAIKQSEAERVFASLPRLTVLPIIGMEDPFHSRCKVHRVFGKDRENRLISGIYQEGTHRIVEAGRCLIENETALGIINKVTEIARAMKYRPYDEDRRTGTLRHLLVRVSRSSNDALVILGTPTDEFPGRNDFVKAIRNACPAVSSIVQNVNGEKTTMVLGKKFRVLYGPGFLTDEIRSCTFRIPPSAFYQVNPVMTEKLYEKAAEYSSLTGRETVIDAYSGVGTIGITLAKNAKQVVGIELNRDAVQVAVGNAKENGCENVRFLAGDAGEYLEKTVRGNLKPDVIVLDPPRSGSTEKFIRSSALASPQRIVYISCNIETLARDLAAYERFGYAAVKVQPFDMFPLTKGMEAVCLIMKNPRFKKERIGSKR